MMVWTGVVKMERVDLVEKCESRANRSCPPIGCGVEGKKGIRTIPRILIKNRVHEDSISWGGEDY